MPAEGALPVVGSRTIAVSTAAVVVSLLATGPAAAGGHRPGGKCPAAEPLVGPAHLVTRTLAKGVTVSVGTAKDAEGTVVIHVLRAQLTDRKVMVAPLVHSLAQRSPLSHLAAGRPHLVAASNTGYFDFRTGAPAGPLISRSVPRMLSSDHEAVVGLGTTGLGQSGNVWLSGTVKTAASSYPLAAINEVDPPAGISVYTRAWGSRIFLPNTAETRPVTGGLIHAHSGRGSTIPSGGDLLVANGRAAQRWLTAVPNGTRLTLSAAVKTNAPQPFVQAFGVGNQLVKQRGVALTGFSCDSANTKLPARTSVGFTAGGRQLVIGFVNDHPGTSQHGLDNNEMSALMVQLGVSTAFSFDGSGSTELLARGKGAKSLTLRTYPADGEERPMPLGLGVFSR
jgi:Phosphodiester glycosidase